MACYRKNSKEKKWTDKVFISYLLCLKVDDARGVLTALTNQNENIQVGHQINVKLMVDILALRQDWQIWQIYALPWEILCMKCTWNYSLSEKRQCWEPNGPEQIWDLTCWAKSLPQGVMKAETNLCFSQCCGLKWNTWQNTNEIT